MLVFISLASPRVSGHIRDFSLLSRALNLKPHLQKYIRYIEILVWLRGLGSKLQTFQDSIVSQFPKETWAQRKPDQKKKNDQKASASHHLEIQLFQEYCKVFELLFIDVWGRYVDN